MSYWVMVMRYDSAVKQSPVSLSGASLGLSLRQSSPKCVHGAGLHLSQNFSFRASGTWSSTEKEAQVAPAIDAVHTQCSMCEHLMRFSWQISVHLPQKRSHTVITWHPWIDFLIFLFFHVKPHQWSQKSAAFIRVHPINELCRLF